MRILFLSDNFSPEVNAPASRTFEHCREWVRQGHEVTVITCVPNFPTGRVFAGYRNRLWQVEQQDGIKVVRVWSFIAANEGFALRILDFLSFMLTSAVAGLFVRRPDVIVGTSPQFFTACSAWFLGAVRRRPFVFELRDIWPESIKVVGAMKDSLAIRLLERLEMFLYRRARLIIAVTHGFRDTLARRGIDPRKVVVVTNGADLSRFTPRPAAAGLRASLGLRDDDFVVGYIGTHGMAHGLQTLLRAALRLQGHPAGAHCRFLFVGNGADKSRLVASATEMGLKNVRFVDPVPKDKVVDYWSVLDVSVLHLLNQPLFATVIPSKLFESMAMGVPVLSSVPGETQSIVATAGAGVAFRAEDDEDLALQILSLAADPAAVASMRERAAKAAPGFDRARLAARMLEYLASCTGAS